MPENRLSQETVEAIITAVSQGRLSQETVEAIITAPSKAVLSQVTVEVLIPSALGPAVTRIPRIPAVNHQNLGVV